MLISCYMDLVRYPLALMNTIESQCWKCLPTLFSAPHPPNPSLDAHPVKGAGLVDVFLARLPEPGVQPEVPHPPLDHGVDLLLALGAEARLVAVGLEAVLDLTDKLNSMTTG